MYKQPVMNGNAHFSNNVSENGYPSPKDEYFQKTETGRIKT